MGPWLSLVLGACHRRELHSATATGFFPLSSSASFLFFLSLLVSLSALNMKVEEPEQ